jgi:DNA-directed RNA polymerase subunit RPC12/RpoP
MPLKVLCAGASKDEREFADRAVRQALKDKAGDGAWTVSLVKIAGQWSVTVDAPSVRSLTLVAPLNGLQDAITLALQGATPPPPPERSAEGRNTYQCEKCQKRFVVRYEGAPGEGEVSVPVACPHCWQVNHLLVAESAAEAMDYRAEKA